MQGGEANPPALCSANMETLEKINVEVKTNELGIEELVSMGLELRERFDKNSWELGDLASLVTDILGPNGLIAVATQIGVDVKTFRRYRDVSRSYPKELRDRFPKLTWSHYKAVLTRPDREALLLRADEEDWTIAKLMAMINPEIKPIDDGKFVPPRPELKFCDVCRKWYMAEVTQLCPSAGQCMETK